MKNKGKKYATLPIFTEKTPANEKQERQESNIERIRRRAREMGIKLAED